MRWREDTRPRMKGKISSARVRDDRQHLVLRSIENRRALLLHMFGDELPELIDDSQRVEIAIALGVAPGEQAMPAENDAVTTGDFQ